MKYWLIATALHFAILALGFGFMGVDFTVVSILGAPLVNLLLWTAMISMAGLAASAARRRTHRWLGRALLAGAVAWFPISLAIFGNARFAGTSDFLWQAWIVGTATLILATLLSLGASALAGLWRCWRKAGRSEA